MKRLLALSLAFALAACTHRGGGSFANGKANFRVGLVLDKGGKDDKSFNSAAFAGGLAAKKDLGIELKTIESGDDAAYEPALRTFAGRGYPLVIAIGFAQTDAIQKVAPEFPNTHFALIDGEVKSPNVASLNFAEHEGSFMAGYLAGLMSKSGKVGFVGGMDIAMIRRFEQAYAAGARAANPKIEVIANFVGMNSSAWINPTRGKELALSQYDKGVDVIFHAAGASGLGVFDAAEERGKFVMGCDSNQNALKPGLVATSMLKKVDQAVYTVIKDQLHGEFKAGRRDFGLKDGGVELAIDDNNAKLVAPYKEKLDKMRGKIISGEVKVPDYYRRSK